VRRNNSDVTVIVPTLNEEEGIGPTIRELRDVLGDADLLVVCVLGLVSWRCADGVHGSLYRLEF